MRLSKFVGLALVLAAIVLVGTFAVVASQGQDRTTSTYVDTIRMLGGDSEIGVSIRDVSEADVQREKLSAAAGALVVDVRGESPAEKAGLRKGDVIVEFDDERVRSARQLSRLVEETPPGRTVRLSAMRGGQRVDLQITPESPERLAWTTRMPRLGGNLKFDIDPDIRVPELFFEYGRRARLGVQTVELTPQLAERFGVRDGVLVTSVESGSAAEQGGLKAGDVIVSVNGRTIDDAGDLRRELSDGPDDRDTSIGVVRDRKELTLTVKLDRPERPARIRTIRRTA
jgi:serine protease Do